MRHLSNERKVVIAGSKHDGPDYARLKLHEEYGRVWLYLCDDDGNSLQNGRLLCIDDDGRLRIAAKHRLYENGIDSFFITIEWPE
jgi:hypothetical protein